MHGIAPDELAIAPHLPDFAQKATREALAAGAPKTKIAAEKRGVRRKLDPRFTPETRAVEWIVSSGRN
jgi:hypothetical protein